MRLRGIEQVHDWQHAIERNCLFKRLGPWLVLSVCNKHNGSFTAFCFKREGIGLGGCVIGKVFAVQCKEIREGFSLLVVDNARKKTQISESVIDAPKVRRFERMPWFSPREFGR